MIKDSDKANAVYLMDIERLKKLEPIMERLGMKPDAWSGYSDITGDTMVAQRKGQLDAEWQALYRADTLEAALPESFYGNRPIDSLELDAGKLQDYITCLWVHSRASRGKARLESLADLIILLDEEGLL